MQKNKLLLLSTLTLTCITWVDVIVEQTKKRGARLFSVCRWLRPRHYIGLNKARIQHILATMV